MIESKVYKVIGGAARNAISEIQKQANNHTVAAQNFQKMYSADDVVVQGIDILTVVGLSFKEGSSPKGWGEQGKNCYVPGKGCSAYEQLTSIPKSPDETDVITSFIDIPLCVELSLKGGVPKTKVMDGDLPLVGCFYDKQTDSHFIWMPDVIANCHQWRELGYRIPQYLSDWNIDGCGLELISAEDATRIFSLPVAA